MAKGFTCVDYFSPFDMPDEYHKDLVDKFFTAEDGCSVSLPVQISTEGEYVVSDGFCKLVDTLEARGARRGEEYIICMKSTIHGHYVIGLNTFRSYLSIEDLG